MNKNKEQAMITFVIPSIGRPSLDKCLKSLIDQSNKNWRAIVGLDGIKLSNLKCSVKDDRITFLELQKSGFTGKHHGVAGTVRNKIMSHVQEGIIAFLDDDDSLEEHYVQEINNRFFEKDIDCLIIKMIYPNGLFLPPINCTRLVVGNVGISFAVKIELLKQNNLWFEPSETEDFDMLMKISKFGKYFISDYIGYKVNH